MLPGVEQMKPRGFLITRKVRLFLRSSRKEHNIIRRNYRASPDEHKLDGISRDQLKHSTLEVGKHVVLDNSNSSTFTAFL